MTELGSSRNNADMHTAVGRFMEPSLRDELLQAVTRGETTMTVLAYVARFPHDEQRLAFERLNPLGARGAKRWMENMLRPPSSDKVVSSVLAFLAREFPAVEVETLEAALVDAARRLESATR